MRSRSTLRVLAALLSILAAALAAEAQTPNMLTAEEQKEGWTSLFDGKTLNGWAPRGEAKWEAQNGELAAVQGQTARGHLATVNEYADFRLRLEFWVGDDGANSGVFLRSPATGNISQGNAFEINIFDKSDDWPTGSINEFQKNTASPNSIGHWNTYDITAEGDHLVVLLNGTKTAETHAMRLPRGPIGLQYGGGTVKFRNIRILAK
jgi:3-keto-disaccharide hydrolase